ncbi:AAA family ATPase [Lysobacter sp. CA196]|uniref:AAA family ATPase n=1 Tax=Lysobacter sp. CA196 TaxID=3455606 RepID=UPI003F8D1688
MYLEHYGLKEPPFSITPDPRFVFLSERHRDALAHLLFGIGQGGGGGFVQLTGEVGTGKTTLCRLLLEQLPEKTRVALVLNPRLTPLELLETICEELHLDLAGKHGSVKALVDALNRYLLDAYARGLRVVLIIDEAQNLSLEALEQVRLLTNLETDTQKLLQIILLGQPELRDMLARPDMRQLSQRITARFHLTPLSAEETTAFLRHRYRIAGGQHLPFTPAAIKRIHAHSGGVPRLINVITERALLGGYAHDDVTIDEGTVNRAATEALAPNTKGFAHKRLAIVAAAAVVVSAFAASWWFMQPPSATANAAATLAKPAKAGAAAKILTRPDGKAGASAADKTAATARAGSATTGALAGVPAEANGKSAPHLDESAFAQRIAAADLASLAAWRQLLGAWQLPADEVAVATAARCAARIEPGAARIAPGAYCLRGSASLDKLVQLGRPVLLHLRLGVRDPWVLLSAMDASRVRLSLDGTPFDTDRAALERLWTGEYAAIWRGPEGLASSLSPRAGGARGEWLRTRLGVTAGATTEDVRSFQSARGLLSDGVVGPETMLALSSGDAGPRLQPVLE